MMTPFKWTAVSIIGIVFMLVVLYASSMQNLTTRSTGETEFVKDAFAVGELRNEVQKTGEVNVRHVNKKELVANFISNLVSTQKTHPYDLKIDYVFYDKNKNVTTTEDEIRSVQFRVQYVNERGEIKGTAERHLAINQLIN